MGENKTKPTEISVAGYIDSLSDDSKRADAKALVKMMQSVTGEKPKMWGSSIIGFGSVHYKYDSGREGDTPALAFSPRKAATVVYGMGSVTQTASVLAKLGKCSMGKGCLYIKKLSDIDQSVLRSLMERARARKT